MRACSTLIVALCVSLGTSIKIDTKLGEIEGVSTSDSVHQFLNIPYAEPPGILRHAFVCEHFDHALCSNDTQLTSYDGDRQSHW